MKPQDLIGETFAGVLANKARSGLTILGIIIGIASVITLVAVGQGATASVTSSISALGSNLLVVTPGISRTAGPVSAGIGSAVTLTKADADSLSSSVPDAKAISADLSRRYQITYKGQNTNTSVIGTQPQYTEIRNVSMALGNFFTDANVTSAAKVAILGPTTRDNLFTAGSDPTGSTIRINKIDFKVIGVTVAKGGSGFTNPDDAIYIPITAAQRYLAGGQSSISDISVEATSKDTINQAQSEITAALLTRHHISDPTLADFTIINQADVTSSLSSVTRTLTLLLGAIAGISLLVGGIGIMNMMLTTVTERTREIGLRKAIGAKRGSISLQFLSESILLTCVGGIIGILLGWIAAALVTKSGYTTAKVTWWSIILAFGVSAVIGIIFGYYPARRAAKLKPIEALKYE